jgi:superfamily I DNA and/or RNA helicase
VEEFSQLDTQQYTVAIERLRQLHAERWRDWSEKPDAKQQIERLKTENNKKQGKHNKIRRFIESAPQLVTTLKPCWLMSPLAVSQYIEPQAVHFDVVIFDEASQIRTEDAVPSIMRATQVIVVGDNQQLPPTSFFAGTASDDEEHEDETIYESLLDECSTFMKDFTLKWHYRSQDESLIAFSNYYFYGSELISFPNPVKDDSRGVHFAFVEEGIYDRAGQTDNIPEAKKAAALTQKHIHDPQSCAQSLGIITFSKTQAKAIREQLDQLSADDPELEAFCQDNSDKFFLKPLELVQGNEADVIFLSFGYGYDDLNNREKLTHNFGPLTKQGGRRRLNVAITRARCKLVLVASIRAEDLKPEGKIQEVEIIRDYFVYAASKGRKLKENPYDLSPSNLLFEEDIYQALIERNYKVDRAVGRSDYPIALAVKDEQQKDRYLLGIECDGVTYRRYPTARDRDRLRRTILEDNLQWNIYRIWSSEWFRDRESQLNQLVERIEHLRVQKSTQAPL